MATYHFSTPLQEEDMRKLHVGDVVYLTGHVFTARDMAHLRIRSAFGASATSRQPLSGGYATLLLFARQSVAYPYAPAF